MQKSKGTRSAADDLAPLDPPLHLTPQDDQLMSERRILCQQRDHRALTLGDSFG
jgi:hypothetical protein